MTATAISNRLQHGGRDGDQARPDKAALIRETHAVFARFGVRVSHDRVTKLVGTYIRRVHANGYAFADYIAAQVAVSEVQRQVVSDELRKVVSYADPTGETAVANVVRVRSGGGRNG